MNIDLTNFIRILSLGFVQLVLALILAPLVNTFLRKLKAGLQGRKGPPLMQGYYDLAKYFHKETVLPDHASWLFFAAPLIMFSVMWVATLLVPMFMLLPELQQVGGIIALVYLFALARFFMMTAALEPGNSFCGMASGREMMMASVIEPAMLLALFVISITLGSTNLEVILQNLAGIDQLEFSPAYILAILALLLTGMAEMGRVPFDNPATHYELTMIHEGMLIEYSGKPLGMMMWASWLKQLLVLTLIANLILPFGLVGGESALAIGPAIVFFIVKLTVLCVILATIETVIAKMRLFRVVDYLGAGFVLALLALVFTVHQRMEGLIP